MRLDARIARLEAAGPGAFLTAKDRIAACDRYAAAYRDMSMAMPGAMTPSDYRQALETERDPKHQRFMACWLPGDDDI